MAALRYCLRSLTAKQDIRSRRSCKLPSLTFGTHRRTMLYPENYFVFKAHLLYLPSYDADHPVVVINHRQMAQSQGAEDNVGSVQ